MQIEQKLAKFQLVRLLIYSDKNFFAPSSHRPKNENLRYLADNIMRK